MANVGLGLSYNFQNEIRDVSGQFEQLRASFPTFLSLVPLGRVITNTKNEWAEDSLSPTSSTIASFDTDGDGTGINLASTAGIVAGSILRFATAADVSRTELVKVDSVDSATDLTVVRDYGGSTGVTLVVGDKVYLVSSPINENTDAGTGSGQEPDIVFNYTEIFDAIAQVSRTAQYGKNYTIENKINYEVANKMVDIMRNMNNAALYGRKVARSSSENGTMGGILQFLEGGNVEATGGALTATHINNALELIFEDGGYSNNYALLCSENQARRISALNTSGANPVVQKANSDRTLGGYISSFIGDIPVQSGFNAKIVVDPNFQKDAVAVVDMNKVYMDVYANDALKDEDATLPGGRYVKRRISGQYSLRVQNGTKAHALISGLTV